MLSYEKDDGSFHDRDALMKTLLHELCHNVVGPHNAVFFALYADVRAEHLALTRKAAGRTRTLADASTKETVARGSPRRRATALYKEASARRPPSSRTPSPVTRRAGRGAAAAACRRRR